MPEKHPRIEREKKTVRAMILIYCRHHHDPEEGLCSQCQALLEYASRRLDRCTFGEEKTTCAKCPVHCYKPEMRERVREVMRYAGPRMLSRHPVMAIRHLVDGRRKSHKRTGQ